jgi:formate hydrogenlyase subunit 4
VNTWPWRLNASAIMGSGPCAVRAREQRRRGASVLRACRAFKKVMKPPSTGKPATPEV